MICPQCRLEFVEVDGPNLMLCTSVWPWRTCRAALSYRNDLPPFGEPPHEPEGWGLENRRWCDLIHRPPQE